MQLTLCHLAPGAGGGDTFGEAGTY
jgi:hypothetical protein